MHTTGMARDVDGGWAIPVLVAATVSSSLSMGVAFSAGVYNMEFLEYFSASSGAVAGVTAINITCALAGGPFAQFILSKTTHRNVTILGGLLSTGGLIAAVFSTRLYHLYITYGVITGLGFSMIHVSGVVLIPMYFERFRNLASACIFSGLTGSSILFPVLIRQLIDTYSWRGSLLVMAGLCFNCCACGVVMRPQVQDKVNKDDPIKIQQKIGKRKQCMSAATNSHFILISAQNILFNISSVATLMFVSDYFYVSGFSKDTSALLLTILGIGQFAGSIAVSILSNFRRVDSVYMSICGHVLCAILTCLFPVVNSYAAAILISVLYGFALGMIVGLVSVVPLELMGLELFVRTYPSLKVFGGIGSLSGPPLQGLVYDVTGSYDIPFYLMGAVMLVAGLVVMVAAYIKSKSKTLPEEHVIDSNLMVEFNGETNRVDKLTSEEEKVDLLSRSKET